jgi:sigma-B regulation protein RsbU (phosphoserine phosphatase)
MRSARGMDQRAINQSDFQFSQGVVGQVAREGKPLLTSNAQADSRLGNLNSIHIFGLRSILCVPLQLKGKTLGVVYVDNHLQSGIFQRDDLELLNFIASSAAIAIENARLYAVAIEKGRLERELQMARAVQTSLLPQQTPQVPGWQFAAFWKPAREVSGDYYDFISNNSGQQGLVIADVSDKGMPAALFMALTRSTVRASVNQANTPAQNITQVNRLISLDAADGMFVTLFYGQLDLLTGSFTYVNAGHNPPVFYQSASEEWSLLKRTGMALGVEDSNLYEQHTIQLEPGDFVFMYTDGVCDATNQTTLQFGEDRLQNVLINNCHSSAKEILDSLEDSVNQFVQDSVPFDDITALIVKRNE